MLSCFFLRQTSNGISLLFFVLPAGTIREIHAVEEAEEAVVVETIKDATESTIHQVVLFIKMVSCVCVRGACFRAEGKYFFLPYPFKMQAMQLVNTVQIDPLSLIQSKLFSGVHETILNCNHYTINEC